jgi:hypothetical protein
MVNRMCASTHEGALKQLSEGLMAVAGRGIS